MVAVGLMFALETLIRKLNNPKNDNDEAVLQKVWFGALRIIAYFKLPLHKDSELLAGNGGCWAVPIPPSWHGLSELKAGLFRPTQLEELVGGVGIFVLPPKGGFLASKLKEELSKCTNAYYGRGPDQGKEDEKYSQLGTITSLRALTELEKRRLVTYSASIGRSGDRDDRNGGGGGHGKHGRDGGDGNDDNNGNDNPNPNKMNKFSKDDEGRGGRPAGGKKTTQGGQRNQANPGTDKWSTQKAPGNKSLDLNKESVEATLWKPVAEPQRKSGSEQGILQPLALGLCCAHLMCSISVRGAAG
jgi:hypothetical protein